MDAEAALPSYKPSRGRSRVRNQGGRASLIGFTSILRSVDAAFRYGLGQLLWSQQGGTVVTAAACRCRGSRGSLGCMIVDKNVLPSTTFAPATQQSD